MQPTQRTPLLSVTVEEYGKNKKSTPRSRSRFLLLEVAVRHRPAQRTAGMSGRMPLPKALGARSRRAHGAQRMALCLNFARWEYGATCDFAREVGYFAERLVLLLNSCRFASRDVLLDPSKCGPFGFRSLLSPSPGVTPLLWPWLWRGMTGGEAPV